MEIIGLKRDEVEGSRRKSRNEKFLNSYFAPNGIRIIKNKLEEYEIGQGL
jgi:hypothetical protein